MDFLKQNNLAQKKFIVWAQNPHATVFTTFKYILVDTDMYSYIFKYLCLQIQRVLSKNITQVLHEAV